MKVQLVLIYNNLTQFYKLRVGFLQLPLLDNSRLRLYTYRMLARVFSCAVIGLDGVIVEVEVAAAGSHNVIML